MDKKSLLEHLLSTLSLEEKLFVALRFNQDLRSSNYMTVDIKNDLLLVYCTKNKKHLPILDELGVGCTNCKLANNISKITQYVNQFRSISKKTDTLNPSKVS